MTIADIKKAIKSAGYQWVEQIYNDGLSVGDCSIILSLSKDPTHFTRGGNDSDIGWGRFTQQEAWERAYNYISNC